MEIPRSEWNANRTQSGPSLASPDRPGKSREDTREEALNPGEGAPGEEVNPDLVTFLDGR